MKVLIACEFSGRVRDAFRARGHDAWSCDLLPAMNGVESFSSKYAFYHFQQDVLEILYDDCWDLLIAHPPCTYLCNSGVCRLYNKDGTDVKERWKKMIEAATFFRTFLCSGIPKICVENPVMHRYALEHIGENYTQTIQPYQFGENASKRTCLWLKGLSPLKQTKVIEPEYACKCGHRFEYALGKYGCPNCNGDSGSARAIWANQTPGGQNKLGPSPDRAKLRGITYKGIADAMADQWG